MGPISPLAASGKHRSLYIYLIMLIIVTLLPVLFAGSVTIWQAGKEFRENSEKRLQDTTFMLAHAIGEEIEQHFTVLTLLAMAVNSSDLSQHWVHEWLGVSGFSENSTIKIETGNTTANKSPEIQRLVHQVITTGKPALSDLIGGDERRTLLAIAVPYHKAEQPAALVLYAVAADLFKLRQQNDIEGSGFLAAITDSQGYIISRSRDVERFSGLKVPDWDKLQQQGTNKGVFEATTKEGGLVIFAFGMVSNTPGWAIVTGEPMALFAAHWQRPLLGIVIGCLIAALVALIAAFKVGRGILSPVKALAEHSRKIAGGNTSVTATSVPASVVSEFEVLRRSLVQAESTLHRRAADARLLATNIANSEKRYRAIAEAGTLVFWRCDIAGHLLEATGWQDLSGQPEEQMLGQPWTINVHPEEFEQVEQHWGECKKTQQPLDVECRISKSNGEWYWVRARGVLLADTESGQPEWVGVLEDIEARKQAEAKILYLAHHDFLTGLANRAFFQKALAEAVNAAQVGVSSSLLALDLDKFKDVNDSLGHPVGDALLQAVTERLKRNCRDTDIIARQGGDEFAILQCGHTDGVEVLAQRLIDSVKAPYKLDQHHINIGLSIGITLITPHTTGVEQALHSADVALYQAKSSGRGCFSIYQHGPVSKH